MAVIYLDNAATTYRKPAPVIKSIIRHTVFNSVNSGRGAHRLSMRGNMLISNTADSVASLFNIDDSTRLAFTQNATYALNLAINGVLSDGGHSIITSMEHNSVLRPIHRLGNYTIVSADRYGFVDPNDIEKSIKRDTKLIACTHISNVCGSIQPIEEIGKIAKERGLVFLVDAAQSAGVASIDVKKQHIDMLAFSGHKGLMGPLGTGGLYVGDGIKIKPYITGGTGSYSKSPIQPEDFPDMLHSGTLNTPAIAALGTATDFVAHIGIDKILQHERKLASLLISHLQNIDGVKILGTLDLQKRNGTVAFTVNGKASQNVASELSEKYNIAVRGGWHCAYLAHKTLGSEAFGAVRASVGFYNSKKDILRLADAVREIANSD